MRGLGIGLAKRKKFPVAGNYFSGPSNVFKLGFKHQCVVKNSVGPERILAAAHIIPVGAPFSIEAGMR